MEPNGLSASMVFPLHWLVLPLVNFKCSFGHPTPQVPKDTQKFLTAYGGKGTLSRILQMCASHLYPSSPPQDSPLVSSQLLNIQWGPITSVCLLESMLFPIIIKSSLYIIKYNSSFTANVRWHLLYKVFPELSPSLGPWSENLWHCFSLPYHTEILPCDMALFSSPTRSGHLRAGFFLTDTLPYHPVPGPWFWPDMDCVPSTPTTLRVHKSLWVRVVPTTLTPVLSHFQGTAGRLSAVTQSTAQTPALEPLANLIPFKGGSQSPNTEKFSQARVLWKWREAAPGSHPRGTTNLAQRLNINIFLNV